MINRVLSTIRKSGLLKKGDAVVVGVSGGPDSTALLYVLRGLQKELKLRLYVAHLDHMLRKDSSSDERFVRALAEKLKLPFISTRIDVKKLAFRGSVEEIARNARLGFLFNTAKKAGARKIALGHTLDDQAETVLMRVLRGSGLYGLSAILASREIAGFEIIRPLIETKRKEIEKFLKSKKITPRYDASNTEDKYFRNKLRNNLLPLLEKDYNSNIKEVLSNLAETSGQDYLYMRESAERFIKRNKISLSISFDNLKGMHPALRRMVIRIILERLQGNTRRINFTHMREIEDLIKKRPTGSIVDLPKGISVIKKKKTLRFVINA